MALIFQEEQGIHLPMKPALFIQLSPKSALFVTVQPTDSFPSINSSYLSFRSRCSWSTYVHFGIPFVECEHSCTSAILAVAWTQLSSVCGTSTVSEVSLSMFRLASHEATYLCVCFVCYLLFVILIVLVLCLYFCGWYAQQSRLCNDGVIAGQVAEDIKPY